MGSDSNFGCTSNFYKQHGNYYISDYNTAVEEGRIAKDYFVFGVMKIKSYLSLLKRILLNWLKVVNLLIWS